MEYTVGAHNITFQSILNGEIRGSTTSSFVVSNGVLFCITTHLTLYSYFVFVWLEFHFVL